MRSPRRSLSRASSIGFGTLFLAFTTYACSERAVAPTATDEANEFAVSGILSSSLWRVNGSQLSYAGSASAHARITQDKNGVQHEAGHITTSTAPSGSVPFATHRFGVPLVAPSSSKLVAPGGAQLTWRTQLESPRVSLPTRDGKRLSLQRVADPRGGGRPPIATMLYDGDRPTSLIEASYAKEGKRWKPTRARITLFGKDGSPSVVTENNYAALQTASVAMPGTAAVLADGFRSVGGTLSKLIQPDVLYAATPGDDGCWPQRLALAAAAAAQLAADIALGTAIAACTTTLVSCPAVLGAMLAVAATSANYLLKVIEYDLCMNPPAPIISAVGGGGGGSEGGGCYNVDWEISYDGGSTWHYYGTQRVCGDQFDT